jgi:hypothetical protein
VQVVFLRGARIATSPSGKAQYAVTPVTAKHNLRQLVHKTTFDILEVKMALLSPPWEDDR